jgi:transposase-like protein
MRQPLQILLDAIPDVALRPLVLELLQNGNSATPAVPAASAPIMPDAAATTTPAAAPAKNRSGRPPGSKNKAKAPAETGAKQAAALAARPGREQLIHDVVEGKLTRAAAARQFGTTPRTVANWVAREQKQAAASGSDQATAAPSRPPGPVGETEAQRKARLALKAARQRERDAERRQQRDADRAAQAAQLTLPVGGNGNGDDAARPSISAARPTLTKTIEPDPAEAALAAKLWRHAAALDPTAPWRPVTAEFGLNAALALNHYRSGTLPPVAHAAASRFCSIAQS